jgi:hypothetical protein
MDDYLRVGITGGRASRIAVELEGDVMRLRRLGKKHIHADGAIIPQNRVKLTNGGIPTLNLVVPLFSSRKVLAN